MRPRSERKGQRSERLAASLEVVAGGSAAVAALYSGATGEASSTSIQDSVSLEEPSDEVP